MCSLIRECWKRRRTLHSAARAAFRIAASTSTSSSSSPLVSLFSSTSTSSSFSSTIHKPRVLRVASFGNALVPYHDALLLQEAVAEARRRGDLTSDVALSLQHASVYTLGKRADASVDLRSSAEAQRLLRGGGGEGNGRGSNLVVESPRGGQATWHGPGQAVLYPVLLLRGGDASKEGAPRPATTTIGVRRYMEELEASLVAVSGRAGVDGCVSGSSFGSPGAWVEETDGAEATSTSTAKVKRRKKIGAVGVRVSRGVATHGAALNVRPDLRAFEAIVPCGDAHAEPTSIEAELSKKKSHANDGDNDDDNSLDSPLDVSRIGIELASELASRLGYDGGVEEVSVAELKRELRAHGYKI